MMSDDDRDIDIESEDDDMGGMDDDDLNDKISLSSSSTKPMTQAEKRAHHNALERKRRDHIKDSFTSLRDSVPSLHGEKVSKRISSRAQILKKAAEYIQFMRRKNSAHQHDIEDLKRQNLILENQIRSLERARTSGSLRSASLSSVSSDMKSMKTRLSESDDGSDGEYEKNLNTNSTSPSPSATSSSSGGNKKMKALSSK